MLLISGGEGHGDDGFSLGGTTWRQLDVLIMFAQDAGDVKPEQARKPGTCF